MAKERGRNREEGKRQRREEEEKRPRFAIPSGTYRYADYPLPSDIADWGCFRPVTTKNRSSTTEGGRKKKRGKNLESVDPSPTRSIARDTRERFLCPRATSSPRAGRRNISPCGEKERDD
ncbi:hypothetical protein B296_00035092, partial [Ensete ventricosum]